MRKHRLVVLGLFVAVAVCPGAARAADAVPNAADNLVANPAFSVKPDGTTSWGFWMNGGSPAKANDPRAKAVYAFAHDGKDFVVTIETKDASAGVTFNAYCKPEVITPLPPGTLLMVSADVRGSLEQPANRKGLTVTAGAQLFPLGEGRTPGDAVAVSPKVEGGKNVPLTGEFDWIPLQVIFPIPGHTGQVNCSFTVENAVGKVEIRNPKVTIAPAGSAANVTLKEDHFASREEAAKARLAKYEEFWAAERQRLGIPDADQIYTPKPALAGPHPRYLFPSLPLAKLKERLNDPALAGYKASLFDLADEYAAAVGPKPRSMDVEDPLRGYAERVPWTALAYLLSDDPAKKQAYLDGTVRMIDAYASWGPPPRDLPNSGMIFGVGAAYDWLYDVLPPETKAHARQYLIDCARWMRSPDNNSAWQWRGQSFWLANHKWWNYGALGMAAAVLWDDHDAGIEPGEPKRWMDEAMQVYWVVRQTFGPDGAPIEGYNYQSYGNEPYFSFAAMVEPLTDTTVSFVDTPGIRNMGVSRLYSLLPNNAGFFTYADSEVRSWSGSESFRFLASRFKDDKSQLLADVMEGGEGRETGVSENYDESVKTYKETADAGAAQTAAAGGGAPIVVLAERMTFPAKVVAKMGQRMGSVAKTTPGWDAAGEDAVASVDVPADGAYRVLVKYAAGGPTERSLKIDGQYPFRECSYIPLASTGGWSSDKNQFRFAFLGADVPPDHASWLFHLAKGAHTLTMSNDVGLGMNLDYLAVVPEGVDVAAVRKVANDPNEGVEPPPNKVVHPWRGLFWYDPAVPSAKFADLALYRDNDDLGVYDVRSSWTDAKATWAGFKCGPPAGKAATALLGFGTQSGHCDPDEGSVLFYFGSKAVLPGTNYCHEKKTSNSSVTVFEKVVKKGNTPDAETNAADAAAAQPAFDEQLGGGGAWFGNNYRYSRNDGTVLDVKHAPSYTSYLCDIGGLYPMGTGPKHEPLYADYRRIVTYLPAGVLVVVDRISTPAPRSMDFRLLTLAKDLAVEGKTFTFHIGRTPGRIVDFSPAEYERKATHERISSFPNPGADPPRRDVATLRAADQTRAVFAAVVAMNGAEQGITVEASDKETDIKGAAGGNIRLDWKDDVQVPAVAKPEPAAKSEPPAAKPAVSGAAR